MNIDQILSSFLNGEPVHDGIVIGIIFVCFFKFYDACFNGLFSFFKK